MARPPKGGYILFTCSACDYSDKGNSYAAVSGTKNHPPECPKCGKPMVEEDRHHRFLRVGTERARKIQEDIQTLAGLASTNYQWEPDDVKPVFRVLHANLDWAEKQFDKKKESIPEVTF